MWVSLFSALIELDIISITNIFNIHQKKWVWRAVNFQTVPRPDLHKIPKEDDDCCGRHILTTQTRTIWDWKKYYEYTLLFCLYFSGILHDNKTWYSAYGAVLCKC